MRSFNALLALAFLFFVTCTSAANDAESAVFGVPQRYKRHFEKAKETGLFHCLSGGQVVNFSQVNDDFCDCVDGSDEPGTAACASLAGDAVRKLPEDWKFDCVDRTTDQSFPHTVINDGFCDCCDGSDEYASGVVCPNTCAEKYKTMMLEREESRKRRLVAIEEKKRLHEIVAKNKEAQASKLRSEKEKLKTLYEQAELKRTQLELKLSLREITSNDFLAATDPLHCVLWHGTKSCDSPDEQAPEDTSSCDTVITPDRFGFCECSSTRNEAKASDYENDYGTAEPGSEDSSDTTADTVKFRFCGDHPRLTCKSVCRNGGVVVDLETEELQEGLDAMNAELGSLNASIVQLEDSLSHPFNTEDYLRALEGREFSLETQENEYVLKLFGEVMQKPKNGRGSVITGRWRSFAESTYSLWSKDKFDYTTLLYDNGDRCWNGAVRQTEVKVVCGPENKVISVEEPSMCRYKLLFETPAVCDDSVAEK